MISELAANKFSLTISSSTGVVSGDKSTCWPFLSQQGLRAFPSPRLTFQRCLGDDFWVGSDSIFVDYLWVNKGCACWRIHASALEVVSLMISQSAPTQFSLTFSESTGAASTSESTRLLWKVFRWWFLSWQRTSFHWLFLSQEGLLVVTNPRVTFGIGFVDDFRDGSGSVFFNSFYVNKGWGRWRIHASPFEVVSLTISQSASTQFSFTFCESIGAASTSESTRHLWKVFRWWFLSWQRTSFRWLFLSE